MVERQCLFLYFHFLFPPFFFFFTFRFKPQKTKPTTKQNSQYVPTGMRWVNLLISKALILCVTDNWLCENFSNATSCYRFARESYFAGDDLLLHFSQNQLNQSYAMVQILNQPHLYIYLHFRPLLYADSTGVALCSFWRGLSEKTYKYRKRVVGQRTSM